MDIATNRGEAAGMKRWPSLLLAASIMCFPTVAEACIYPPPSPRKAEETDAEYSARAQTEFRAYLLERARQTETSYFEAAKSTYLARIVRSEEISVAGSQVARQIVLLPVRSIRGILPSLRVTAKDREMTSCGLGGDGPATAGNVGQMAVVFDGVRNEGMNYRSPLYVVLAESVQEPRLLAAWDRWKAQPSKVLNQ
jgi:hypothetical protein